MRFVKLSGDMDGVPYLTTRELADRWGCSVRTIQNWRMLKKGPQFHHRITRGCQCIYMLPDVEAYEKEHFILK